MSIMYRICNMYNIKSEYFHPRLRNIALLFVTKAKRSNCYDNLFCRTSKRIHLMCNPYISSILINEKKYVFNNNNNNR